MTAIVLAVALAVLPAGCGVLSPEEQILSDFFHAARLRDLTMVARVSPEEFNPRTEGVVERFRVVARGDDGAAGDTRTVTIAAVVRRPDGQIEERMLIATLERRAGGRWRLARLDR